MKKILFGILALIAVIFTALYFYVINIDWNKHKGRLVDQVMDATGKKIMFEGRVKFSLLPAPYLEAKNVKLYNKDGVLLLADIPSLVAELDLVPLLKGNLNVKSMTLNEPKLNIRISSDGKFNWSDTSKFENYDNMPTDRLALNSVMIKHAVVDFHDEIHSVRENLKDVTAEVSAESINGPFRFEGNFTHNAENYGFMLAVGEQQDGYTSPVNLALIHSPTESYLRFDGTIILENNAISGSFLAESKNFMELVQKIDSKLLGELESTEPLTISAEIKTNKTRIDLSNFVVKYGQNIGAGNIIIPVKDNASSGKNKRRPKIEALFEMTDLDLNMVRDFAKDKVVAFFDSKDPYSPNMEYDFVLDLKSIRTFYNSGELQNFALSFEIINNIMVLKNIGFIAPGNTKVAVRGRLYPENDIPTYNVDFAFITDDLKKMLVWAGYEPNQIIKGTYRSAQVAMNILGTSKNVRISPLKATVDNININGSINYISDIRDTWYLDLISENFINFDNYLTPLPEGLQEASKTDKFLHRFKELSFLNNYDLYINTKIPSGIIDKTVLGPTEANVELINGKMDIKKLELEKFYETNITAEGSLSGFGENPIFDRLEYSIEAEDFQTFLKNMEQQDKFTSIRKNGKFASRGILQGSIDNLALKTVTNIGDTEFTYDGKIVSKTEEPNIYDGSLGIKAPDFSQFMEDFFDNKEYQFINKSLFSFNSQISGNSEKFNLTDFDLYVGTTAMSGSADVNLQGEKSKINGDVSINTIDLDSLLFTNKDILEKKYTGVRKSAIDLKVKPSFDLSSMNYDVFQKFEYEGLLSVDVITYNDLMGSEFSTQMRLADGEIVLDNIKTDFDQGKVSGNIKLNIKNNNELTGRLNFDDYDVKNLGLYGTKYGLIEGVGDYVLKFTTKADSVAAIVSEMVGTLNFRIKDLKLKGWNLEAIYSDLKDRETSESLLKFVSENLEKGTTTFAEVTGDIKIDKNEGIFENTNLVSEYYPLVMNGSFNLDTWKIDTTFDMSFPTLKELPNMQIKFNEGLDRPKCTADVKAIADKYDNYWQKLAQEKEERRLAEEKKVRDALLSETEKLKPIKKEIESELLPFIQNRIEKENKESVKKQYNEANIQAHNILDSIESLLKKETQEKISNEDIEEVKGKSVGYNDQIQKIQSDLKEFYETSVRDDYTAYGDEMIDLYKSARLKVDDYRVEMRKYLSEATKFYPIINMPKDDGFIKSRDAVEEVYLSLETIYSKVMHNYYEDEANLSLEKMETYNHKIMEYKANAQEQLLTLDERIKASLDYMKEQIEEAQRKFEEEQIKIKEKFRKTSDESGTGVDTDTDAKEDAADETHEEVTEEPVVVSEKDKVDNEIKDDKAPVSEASNQEIEQITESEDSKVDNPSEDKDNETVISEEEPVLDIKEEEKPKLTLKEVIGEIKAVEGKIIRTSDMDKEMPADDEQQEKDQPTYLRKIDGEINPVIGTVIKK